jgi:hypothetical protein
MASSELAVETEEQTMPFRWNYGGPSWAVTTFDASSTLSIRLPLGADRLFAGGNSESTGTYRSLRVVPGLDGDGTRGQH